VISSCGRSVGRGFLACLNVSSRTILCSFLVTGLTGASKSTLLVVSCSGPAVSPRQRRKLVMSTRRKQRGAVMKCVSKFRRAIDRLIFLLIILPVGSPVTSWSRSSYQLSGGKTRVKPSGRESTGTHPQELQVHRCCPIGVPGMRSPLGIQKGMLETAAAQNAIRDACALTHAHATEVDLQTRMVASTILLRRATTMVIAMCFK